MKIQKIEQLLNTLFPFNLQEEYDNSGAQILFHNETVRGILFSLDLDESILQECTLKECNCIITHHPLFFKPLKSIRSDDPHSKLILSCIEKKISIISLHTNADKFYWSKLSETLHIETPEILLPETPEVGESIGYGIYARLDKKSSLKEFLERIKHSFDLNYCIFTGDPESIIQSFAVLNGSGGKYVEFVLQNKDVDVVITGDVGYHQAKLIQEYNAAIIDAGHFGTEKAIVIFLKEALHNVLTKEGDLDITLHIAESEVSPLQLYT